MAANEKVNTLSFIDKANIVHNSFYSYTKTVYTNTYGKIIIGCPIHGDFEQVAKDHLKGGCRKCALTKRKQTCLAKFGVENTFQSEDIKRKAKETMIERYGEEHNSLLPTTIQKRKDTCMINHGVTSPLQNEDIMEKVKATNVDKYGVENPQQNTNVREQTKETNISKYGVEYPASLDIIRDKIKNTMVEKYGVTHNWMVPDIRQDIKQTNIEKYGVEFPSQSDAIKEKIKQNMLETYGVEHFAQRNIPPTTIEKLNSVDWLVDQHHVQQKTLSTIAEELKVSNASMVRGYFVKRGVEIKHFRHSTAEQCIKDYIEELGISSILTSDRSVIAPLELDIYLPEFNLAIEYNGIYWHSELKGKDKRYHLNKTQKCAEKGIRLIHIFENEWVNNQEIVKSRIASLLGKNKIIYARKCKVVPLTNIEAAAFFNGTHIQGSANASIRYGLEYEGQIVAATSIGKSRFNKQVEYELIRFANALHTNVIGGAGKIFKHFLKEYNPSSIISYSDKRWNTGNLYIQLGFTHTHTAAPNYYYFRNGTPMVLKSRQTFQKHKLPKVLDSFDIELTEWENMVANGYDRIWDCGNDVFLYNNE